MKIILILANILLLYYSMRIFNMRYEQVIDGFQKFDQSFSVLEVAYWLKHEILILLAGTISLIGISVNFKNKLYFFSSSLFAASQIGFVIFAASFSIIYFCKLFSLAIFVYFLISGNAYPTKNGSFKSRLIVFILASLSYLIFLKVLIY